MESLNEMLYKLLNEEIDSLSLGHLFNSKRIQKMREICHILTYYKYVDVSDNDIIKLIRFYE